MFCMGVAMRRKDKRIANEYRDSDGYWIEMADGWCDDSGAHGIVEDTKRAAYDKLRSVARPCRCAECAERMRKVVA
jgi:hypothetical protein